MLRGYVSVLLDDGAHTCDISHDLTLSGWRRSGAHHSAAHRRGVKAIPLATEFQSLSRKKKIKTNHQFMW